MLKTSGSTYLGKTCIIVWVVWSSATLAPTTSLALSSLTLTPTTFLVPEDDFTISIFIQFIHFYLVISLSTSAIICPTDCKDFNWLSVLVTYFLLSLNSKRSKY
jgi:hypothetical protein